MVYLWYSGKNEPSLEEGVTARPAQCKEHFHMDIDTLDIPRSPLVANCNKMNSFIEVLPLS